jgi:hypothetical protein
MRDPPNVDSSLQHADRLRPTLPRARWLPERSCQHRRAHTRRHAGVIADAPPRPWRSIVDDQLHRQRFNSSHRAPASFGGGSGRLVSVAFVRYDQRVPAGMGMTGCTRTPVNYKTRHEMPGESDCIPLRTCCVSPSSARSLRRLLGADRNRGTPVAPRPPASLRRD